MLLPTAVHALEDVHDTLVRALTNADGGSGIGWSAQRRPSQRSASATSRYSPRTPWYVPRLYATPTAVQAVGDAHDTAERIAFAYPEGLAVRWIDQRWPSHLSASVTSGLWSLPDPSPSRYSPTAIHEFGDGHATPFTAIGAAAVGSVIGATSHRAPFQRSRSRRLEPARL
jgi:hypothetical protein